MAVIATNSFNTCAAFVGTAPCLFLGIVQGNVFWLMLSAAMVFCGAIFLVGCLTLVLSGGSQNLVERGKGMIKWSLIGYAVIGSSYIILVAFTRFLYP